MALVDEVVVAPFKMPRSYTGEDLVEISCHGSPVITEEILSLCIANGARLARRGEFTERAFLAGKLDLSQAEAVLDLIQAKTERQSRVSLSILSGELGRQITDLRTELMSILTGIVAAIDFPEDVGEPGTSQLIEPVEKCRQKLANLAKTARSGRFLREGLKVAIVGRPNAGKSSLLNRLLQFERAIVTSVPGTTRDSLEEMLDLNGIPVMLVDTAGIRHTEDQVERIGIERSQKAVELSDLVIFTSDLTSGWGEAEEKILSMIGQKPFILLQNKVDIVQAHKPFEMKAPSCLGELAISAKTGQGLPELTKVIEEFVFTLPGEDSPYLNARQAAQADKAKSALDLVLETLSQGFPQDCLATDLKAAIDALSEICGENVTEEVIHNVFAQFCLGK